MAKPVNTWLHGIEGLIELLTELRATVMSLFSIPTQEVIRILRIRFATPENGFECLPTLMSTGGHIVHRNLNIQHPVTNFLGFAILPNENRAHGPLMDFQHCICDLTWDGLAF